jgi:hypothetical protein
MSSLMATANEIARRAKERRLLDHPQPLGILPTWWFWNDRKNWRLVGWGFGLLAAIVVLVLPIFHLHPLVGGAIAAAVVVLANGLLEKYIRRQALKRRALADAALAGEKDVDGRRD